MNKPLANKEQTLILNGGVWKMMWTLSWPAVIAMVLYGLNTLVDGIFVGRYVGESALAGVTLVYPVAQLLQGLGSLIGVGAGSYLSLLIGRKALEEQRRLTGNVNRLIVIIGLAVTVLGLVLLKPLMGMLGASPEEAAYGIGYIRIVLAGSVFWIAGLAYNMIVRAEGKMATAAWMMGVGLLCNIVLNFLLMGVLKLGVAGAAIGTDVGMLVYALLFLRYAKKGQASFEVNFASFSHDREATRQIVSLGFPSLLMTVMYVIQSFVIMRSLSAYGTPADVAFYGSIFRLFNLFLSPIYGLMRALQPAVGINYGAKKYERVIRSYKVFSVAALALLLPLWLYSMAQPQVMLGTMLPGRVLTGEEISNFRIFMLTVPFLPVIFMAMTFWPAISKPKPAGMLGVARQVLLYIPAMILLPRFFGISWIYKGSFIIDTALSLLVAALIAREFSAMRKAGSEENG